MVQYAARNLVKDRGDVLHVLYVALEQEHCEKPQRQVRSCSVLILGRLTHKLLVKMESHENGQSAMLPECSLHCTGAEVCLQRSCRPG